jgi:UMF1 family MFS transporter
VFGILAIISGAIFAFIGGRLDVRFGPKPVITVCILVLTAVAISTVMLSRESVYGVAIAPGSAVPDLIFMIHGILIGAAGGVIQSASRTMMVRQANPERMTEAFGLYALAGKSTSFLAPLSIGALTAWTGSQQIGVSPLIVLFLLGLVLLYFVKNEGDFG